MIADPSTRIHGAASHTGYPEYDCMTGYLVGTFTAKRYDKRRGCTIITEYEVINLGRPDRGIPVDPEEAMAEDKLETYYGGAGAPAATEENKRRARERHAQMQQPVVEYLMAYGTATVREIAADLGIKVTSMINHVYKLEGEVYCRCGTTGGSNPAIIWGVVGVHDGQ